MSLVNKQVIVCPKTGELILAEVSPEHLDWEAFVKKQLAQEEQPHDEDGNNLITYDDEENNFGKQYDYDSEPDDDDYAHSDSDEPDDTDEDSDADSDDGADSDDDGTEVDHFSNMVNEVWAELCKKKK
tara:strand:+ start:82 stop:465 length:384 start_codon:yes stop_codon:yes gene_type:complete